MWTVLVQGCFGPVFGTLGTVVSTPLGGVPGEPWRRSERESSVLLGGPREYIDTPHGL